MTGRLAVIPDFSAPLPSAVPIPKGSGESGNLPPAAQGADENTISEFAQLIRQIEGQSVLPQDASTPANTLPQLKTPSSPDVAASPDVAVLPERQPVQNKPAPLPVPSLPSVPAVRHAAKTDPSPAKTEKTLTNFDQGFVVVDMVRPAPATHAAPPPTFQMGGGTKMAASFAQGPRPAEPPNPQLKPEPALSHTSVAEKATSTPSSADHLAIDEPSPPRPDQTNHGGPEPSAPMDVSTSGPEPAPRTPPPEVDASPAAGIAKAATVAAFVKPSLLMSVAAESVLRHTRPALSEGKPVRMGPAAAPTDMPQTIEPSAWNAPPPASPPVAAPDGASHDTPVQSMPGVQRSAKTDPGPVAVELNIRPHDPTVDRVAQQLRVESHLNIAPAVSVLHTAEPTSPLPAEEPAAASARIMHTIPSAVPGHLNPITADVPQAPALSEHPAAKQEAPPLAPSHAADVLPDQPKQPVTALRSISLDFAPDGAQDVHVRLAERGGDVHVSLHSTDSAFAGRLADGVQDLVGTLANAGYDAQAWTPGQGHQNPRQHEEPQPQRDESNESSEEFSAMMQEPNEEVS